MKHKYDNPTLSAVGFLIAVMHDPDVPLEVRMEAAGGLLNTDHAEFSAERPPAVIYRFADYQPPEADDDSDAA